MLSSLVTCPTLYKGGYMVNVEGVLVDPMSNPLLNHEIRITTRQTVNSTIEEVTSSEFTDGLGNYSFTLGDGWFYLEILLNDTFMSVGDLIVNSGTPTPISLPDLLKYSDPVVVDALTYPPFWQNLIDTLDGSPLTGSRTSREQMVDSLVHVAEIKTTDVSDDGLRRKATYDTDVKTCDSQVTKQSLAYSDDINYLASSSHLHKSKSASHEESLVITDEVNTTKLVTAAGYTEGITEAVIATGSEVQSLKTFDTIIHEEKETILTDSITLLNKLSSTLGVQTHTINLDSTVYVDSNTVTVGTDYLKRYSDLSDKIYESKSGAKVTSDTHSNNGARSTKKIVVDDFIVGREGNDLFEVDNDLNRVTVRGSFRVTDLQDANGNSIEVSDGDTIFRVLQYSDVATGPWHDDVLASDYWRRENLSVNGVVDAGTWDIPYQFRADTAVGNPGDTIYIEYNYSPDGATSWHETLQAGDAYRRERTIINGIPGDWSAIARIIGDNGDEIEIRSQYSVDGINFWHSTFVSGDKYERRARFVNGLIASTYSDPFKIVGTDAVGIPGLNGSGWYTIVGNAGVWPGDTIATAAFITEFGRVPQLDDHLFYVNQTPDPTATDGKRCITPIGGGTPVWNSPLQYIDGDMIVAGTLSADRLVANTITGNEIDAQTTIIAGSGSTTSGMNGYDLATLPDWLGGGTNNYANYRFWAGATDPSLANFSVSDTGILKASNAEISGTITIGNTALTEANTLNVNTSKTDVGLGNVDNTSDATVLAGDLTGSVSGTAVATIKSGAAAGSTANQSSNATIRAVGAATSGTTGGWTIDTNSIYSGTKDTGGFAPAGSITLYSGGSIHTPWFYSQASGAAFKGDISLATGTLTAASIKANNIEGDVYDAIPKIYTTSFSNVGTVTLFSGNITDFEKDRTLLVGTLGVQTVASTFDGGYVSIYLQYYRGTTKVFTSNTVTNYINASTSNTANYKTLQFNFFPYTFSIPWSASSTAYSVKAVISKSGDHYNSPVTTQTGPCVVSIFISGGSLS